MPRLPAWGHRPAGTSPVRGVRYRPITRVPVTRFRRVLPGVPLTGGQAQSTIGADGTGTVSVTPQGLGTVWYPNAATISTTTGAADTSTCQVFLGAIGVSNLLVGQSYAGGGDTVALAVPALTPGALLIAQWSGGNPGDVCSVNVLGTMDALTV
jgi:hypothetical protein